MTRLSCGGTERPLAGAPESRRIELQGLIDEIGEGKHGALRPWIESHLLNAIAIPLLS